jgi:hypothetical protein
VESGAPLFLRAVALLLLPRASTNKGRSSASKWVLALEAALP